MKAVFQPNLTLAREPDGEFTLHAVTVTPNSSYSAGRARQGVPANVRILPEVAPILLDLRHRGGIALQVLTPVRHTLRNVDLAGKTSVTAFAVLDGAVVGSTTVAIDQQVAGTGPVSTSDWYAWADRMPPGPATLRVQGVVQLPTPGWSATLTKAAPQGINPRDLILDLDVRPPGGGFWPEVVTPATVTYVEEEYGGAYETVLVRIPGLDAVQLVVEDVY